MVIQRLSICCFLREQLHVQTWRACRLYASRCLKFYKTSELFNQRTFSPGTTARSDLEGLQALRKQVPEVLQDLRTIQPEDVQPRNNCTFRLGGLAGSTQAGA